MIDEQGAYRIAATVNLRYADQRLNTKGVPQGETTTLALCNCYVYGRDGGIGGW